MLRWAKSCESDSPQFKSPALVREHKIPLPLKTEELVLIEIAFVGLRIELLHWRALMHHPFHVQLRNSLGVSLNGLAEQLAIVTLVHLQKRLVQTDLE